MIEKLLRINDIDVDIDEKTALGIDLQSYDVVEPSKPKINISNTFSIPATSKNLNIFGLANDPQTQSTKIYDVAICNYWVNNDQLITDSKVRVENITDRINLFVYEKQDFWEEIKEDFWPDFIDDFIAWMNTENNLPIESDPNTGDATDFLDDYFTSTEGVYLPLYIGNLGDYIHKGQFARESQTVDYTFSLVSWTLTIIVTSDLVSGSPVTINESVFGGATQEQVTQIAVDAINNNSAVSEHYTAIIEDDSTGEFIVKGDNTEPDPNLNIAVSGSQIVNETTSVFISAGVEAGTDFMEVISQLSGSAIDGNIVLKWKTQEESLQGGHFSVYVKTLFEYIESRYNVNLLTSGGVLPGNIWDDAVANDLFIPVKDLQVHMEDGNNYFYRDTDAIFAPNDDVKFCEDKTVFDFVKAFMNHLNIVKDEIKIGTNNYIRFARFDDLDSLADIVDFSGKLSGVQKFMPKINNYAQNNYVKFKEVYEDGSEFINSKKLTCSNQNLDINSNLIEIDAFVPGIVETTDSKAISFAKDSESFKTFTFYVSTQSTTKLVTTEYADYTASYSAFFGEGKYMEIAELYSLDSEYNLLDEIITYPKVYEIKKWLTIEDIRNFEFFKLYYIQDLSGAYFVNKIKGFNPDSKQPTTLELIKISDKTPAPVFDLDLWVDGVQDEFVDGELDYFY